MRNSTAEKTPAKPAAQGPFRTGAILPFFVLVALTWSYFHFFFDAHLRRGLEYAGTRAVGAEVNVAGVETRFWQASAVVRGIQVTDAAMPTRNLVQIGSVSFQALWDGLLRGKLVIDHMEVLDIEALAPRAAPGRVLPVDPDATGAADELLANARREFEGNVLGDLAAIAAGADPAGQLGQLGDELKSSARIAALGRELTAKEQAWQKRLASLPRSDDLAALEQRLAKVKLDRFKDLNEFRASLGELEAIRDQVNRHVKNVQATNKAVGSDVSAFRAAYAEIDQAVKQDVRDLQAHYRIPELNAGRMGNVLFGPELLAKVASTRGYMDKTREYLPPRRTAEQKAAQRLQPPPRGEGRNYTFGRPRAYPAFWLKRATISSRSGKGPYSGDLAGTLTDATTDPALVGRPLVFQVQGDFPGLDIHGAKLELVVDHTTERPVERFTGVVGRFPVAGRTLVQSDGVTLGFDKAGGSSRFAAELRGETVDLQLVNDFSAIAYQVKAKSSTVQEMLAGALTDVPAVNVTARVSGSWSKLDWHLATNLGAALERGFRRQVQAQIERARARVEAMVNERVAGERAKLEAQYAAASDAVSQQLAAAQKETERLRARMDEARGRLDRQKKGQEQKLREGLKGVLPR